MTPLCHPSLALLPSGYALGRQRSLGLDNHVGHPTGMSYLYIISYPCENIVRQDVCETPAGFVLGLMASRDTRLLINDKQPSP